MTILTNPTNTTLHFYMYKAQATNQLLKEAKIDLFKSKEGLLYKIKTPSKAM